MTQAALGPARLPASLTSFMGREQEAAELARALRERRLVTVTGPGGVGKTRLATEVARAMAGEFPDGVYFVGLRAVTDEARVAAAVAADLGIGQAPGKPAVAALTTALAAQRLLLVLDNCEHVLAAAAELCRVLLESADDLHILATSREQLWVGGETRYRLAPLDLPGRAEPTGVAGPGEAARVTWSPAVALFIDRARQADRAFSLAGDRGPLAARVVSRLDGIPLAIELAAARVEALGLAGLADHIDDALRLEGGPDAPSADPARSLMAVADWSYRLLSPAEQLVFRRVAAFPGPFTLEGAEAVAGPETGPVLLRLVDCSLVAPPRPGPDQRMRYTLLQTLRAYGLARLADAGEERQVAASLAGFALSLAEQAALALETADGELGAARWLDAEDATVGQALDWALGHDHEAALRLAVAVAPWWLLRGRVVGGYRDLAAAVSRSSQASESLGRAHCWLGHLANFADPGRAIGHYTAASESADPRAAIDALSAGQAVMLLNYGQPAEAGQAARQAITLARAAGYPGGEAQALTALSVIAHQTNAPRDALALARQAEGALDEEMTPRALRWCRLVLLIVLTETGEYAAARRVCGDSLARSRAVGDLADLSFRLMVHARLERLSGNQADAAARLHEAVRVARRVGGVNGLLNCLDEGSCFCAAQGLWPAAVTLRAAYEANMARAGVTVPPGGDYAELMRRAPRNLPAGKAREAAERGARMTPDAAAEFIAVLSVPREAPAGQAPARRAAAELTERERELVALVAQGHTNAQIAAALFISVRTVTSHLDRIHGKTGYRRRADLTRLALSEGLV